MNNEQRTVIEILWKESIFSRCDQFNQKILPKYVAATEIVRNYDFHYLKHNKRTHNKKKLYVSIIINY